MPQLATVILAAGAGSRFGRCKQLAKFDDPECDGDNTMIDHIIQATQYINKEHVYLVLGRYQDEIREHLKDVKFDFDVEIINNPNWRQGISSSISCAIEHADDKHDAMLFTVADQVALKEKHFKHMQTIWEKNPDMIVAAEYDNTVSVPAIFPKAFYKALLNLEGDKGPKAVLSKNRQNLISVPMPEAGWDIDTPEDLQDWNSNNSQ